MIPGRKDVLLRLSGTFRHLTRAPEGSTVQAVKWYSSVERYVAYDHRTFGLV